MSLPSGTRLGPYEIQSAIGAGGMGEVYKARDTRLDRSVAIKILPPELSADPDRRARFVREAKTIAGLSHPHICALYDVGEHDALYDVGEHDGSMYLVMEHLAGETLAARLEKGPLPLEQALTIATEIADALATAHRQGVIHRDLKPANLMLTKTGAKLLDFGLAKLKGHGDQPAAAQVASMPTRSVPLTAEGTIVGTLQYMAPEQVEGKPADARTDLWALGAILYEMLTGKRAFEGTSAASLITAIMGSEPAPLATFQPLTPTALDRLVRQCLAKAPEDRPDTAHDVANDLRWIRESSGVTAATDVRRPQRWRLRRALWAAGLVVAAGSAGAGVMWVLRPSPSRVSLVRTELPVRPAEAMDSGGVLPALLPTPGGSRTALTWTPDGQVLVFVGRQGGVQRLYLRRLDAPEAQPLANTEGAQVPAVSPDGQWVAFWANGAIRKLPLGGGPVMDLTSGLASPPAGLVWNGSGRLFFGRVSDGRIWAISAEGTVAAVTTLGEAEGKHVLPWPLPGGQTLLYTVRRRLWSWGDEEVVAHTLSTGECKVLLKDAADARYLPTGHLVFLRRGQLFAAPFDAERLEMRDRPVAVLDGVAEALTAGNLNDLTGAGQFAVSAAGTLAWVAAPPATYPARRLVTVDRQGHVSPLTGAPVRSYGAVLRISPDGRRLAVTIPTLSEAGVWVFDMSRGDLRPLARDGEALYLLWSPDGQRLVFDWVANGRQSLVLQPADFTTAPRELFAGQLVPSSFTPDGKRLAAVRARRDIVMVTVEGGAAPEQFLTQAPHQFAYPVFSPDGRWLAYASNGSGRFEVYVRPYPGPGPVEPVSLEGGWCPAWNPTGRELFFLSLTDPAGKIRMMAVEFAAGPPPRIGRPRLLFEFAERDLPLRGWPVRRYDVAPDGERFYAITDQTPQAQPAVTHINLIEHWFEELKAKVPVR